MAACSVMTSCHRIAGEGPTVMQSYNYSGFNGISSGIDGDVYFTQDSVYSVRIYAQANIMSEIQTSIENGVLQLHYKPLANIGRHDPVTIYVSAPAVYSLLVDGSGTLNAQQAVISSDLHLKVDGSGSIFVAHYSGSNLYGDISGSGSINVAGGTARNESFHISGSGNIEMLGVLTKTCDTHTSGSGTTKVNVSDDLNVNISGSGDVYYSGNPSVHSSISGSGTVMHY